MYIGKYKINQAGRGLKMSIPSFIAKNRGLEGGSEVHIFLLKDAMFVSDRKPFTCNRCGNHCLRVIEDNEHGEVFSCCGEREQMFGPRGRCVLCMVKVY